MLRDALIQDLLHDRLHSLVGDCWGVFIQVSELVLALCVEKRWGLLLLASLSVHQRLRQYCGSRTRLLSLHQYLRRCVSESLLPAGKVDL